MITLRPYSSDDQEFLFLLYADTRQQEVSSFGWAPAQQEAFLLMQFNAQQRWYGTAYSGANDQLILLDGKRIGRILVFREQDANRLVDIAVLAEARGRGIGTQLLGQLIENSRRQGLPVRLQVLKSNPARHLYERLGFVATGDDGMYHQMECNPTRSASS